MKTTRQTRSGCGRKLSQAFLGFDSFAESFQMKLDSEGSESVPSCSGSIMSVLSLTLTAVYFGYQFMIFQAKTGQEMTLSIEEQFFTEYDVFGSDDGLMIAAVALDETYMNIIDPEKGELVFYHQQEWYDENDM